MGEKAAQAGGLDERVAAGGDDREHQRDVEKDEPERLPRDPWARGEAVVVDAEAVSETADEADPQPGR